MTPDFFIFMIGWSVSGVIGGFLILISCNMISDHSDDRINDVRIWHGIVMMVLGGIVFLTGILMVFTVSIDWIRNRIDWSWLEYKIWKRK